MDQPPSTLELVRYDETARAPERDYDATAFELDSSALAPQTVPDITPQVLYDTSLPEVHGNENSSIPSVIITKPTLKWLLMIIALIIVAAIAIGVSVGIWYHREHSSPKSSPFISSPTSQNPKPTPSPNITHTAQFILNDTSLAAIILPNGDRQLFFQDTTGHIRRTGRTTSDNQWSTTPWLSTWLTSSTDQDSNNNVTAPIKPKDHTPLALGVTVIEGSIDPGSSTAMTIDLYYISESHILSSSFSSEQGIWISNPILGNYSTAADTRSLSISSISGGSHSTYSTKNSSTNYTTNSALLFYETPTGKVSALLQTHAVGYGWQQTQWIDITSQESKSLPMEFRNAPGPFYNTYNNQVFPPPASATFSHTLYEADASATYGAPFTSGANVSGIPVEALFYSPPNALLNSTTSTSSSGFASAYYTVNPSGPGNFTDAASWAFQGNNPSIHQSDIAMFGTNYAIWINGTRPVSIYSQDSVLAETLPDVEFPFARLASVTLADQSATFIYHQLDGTTFAEEQWDFQLNEWHPSVNITVS